MKKLSKRKGAAAVEFAIVSSIVFFLLFAFVAFSRVNTIRHTIENGAYEGARRGIVPGATGLQVISSVRNVLQSAQIAKATITVAPSVITDETPSVAVTISVPVAGNLYTSSDLFAVQTLRSSCTLTRESFGQQQKPAPPANDDDDD